MAVLVPSIAVVIAVVGLGSIEPEAEPSSDPQRPSAEAPDDVAPDDVAPDDVAPDDVAPDDATPDDVPPDDGPPPVEPDASEPDASEPDASEPDEPVTSPAGGSGGGGGGAAGSGTGIGSPAGGPSRGALPSGQAKSDDVPVDEDMLEADRRVRRSRRARRNRRRDHDEGQWQVFAPYPELGPIRYRDPENRRTVWLGLDATGTYLPTSLGLSDRAVWTVRPAGAWAVALTPWLAVGGRHAVTWYDIETARIRVHEHQAELSGRPLAGSRPDVALDDRLSVGVTTHEVRWADVADTTAEPAGVRDTILHFGYGLDHLLGTRWRLGWQAQARYAWVEQDTQRQVRLSMRLAFNPRPAHRLSMDAVGFYVNRDSEPAGQVLPRHGIHGQFGLGYSWVGRAGVGPWTNVRATTAFRSGEAPVYELREESLEAGYGEVLVGMLARWP